LKLLTKDHPFSLFNLFCPIETYLLDDIWIGKEHITHIYRKYNENLNIGVLLYLFRKHPLGIITVESISEPELLIEGQWFEDYSDFISAESLHRSLVHIKSIPEPRNKEAHG
jgi:hypothetical protein